MAKIKKTVFLTFQKYTKYCQYLHLFPQRLNRFGHHSFAFGILAVKALIPQPRSPRYLEFELIFQKRKTVLSGTISLIELERENKLQICPSVVKLYDDHFLDSRSQKCSSISEQFRTNPNHAWTYSKE